VYSDFRGGRSCEAFLEVVVYIEKGNDIFMHREGMRSYYDKRHHYTPVRCGFIYGQVTDGHDWNEV